MQIPNLRVNIDDVVPRRIGDCLICSGYVVDGLPAGRVQPGEFAADKRQSPPAKSDLLVEFDGKVVPGLLGGLLDE